MRASLNSNNDNEQNSRLRRSVNDNNKIKKNRPLGKVFFFYKFLVI